MPRFLLVIITKATATRGSQSCVAEFDNLDFARQELRGWLRGGDVNQYFLFGLCLDGRWDLYSVEG